MLLISYIVVSSILGLFTIYFGSGRSRIIGGFLVVLAAVVFVFYLWFVWYLPFLGPPPISLYGCVFDGVVAVLGAIVGAVLGLGLFIFAMRKT
jgi:hypothetical protein